MTRFKFDTFNQVPAELKSTYVKEDTINVSKLFLTQDFESRSMEIEKKYIS